MSKKKQKSKRQLPCKFKFVRRHKKQDDVYTFKCKRRHDHWSANTRGEYHIAVEDFWGV